MNAKPRGIEGAMSPARLRPAGKALRAKVDAASCRVHTPWKAAERRFYYRRNKNLPALNFFESYRAEAPKGF